MPRSIWDRLFEFLVELLSKQGLAAAGASPATIRTISMPLGSGYVAPGPPSGALESREIQHLHPALAERYLLLKEDFHRETGRQLFETCTWRSQLRQLQLYQEGRELRGGVWIVVDRRLVKTNCDGTLKRSRHNVFPAEAVDVAVDIDPGPGQKILWDNLAFEPLGQLALRHGLVWGGDWNRNLIRDEKWRDTPHLELPAGLA